MIDPNVRAVLWAKNKNKIKYPFGKQQDRHIYFGVGEFADILSFGFSFIEHEDHMVSYILTSPRVMRRIIREVDELGLVADMDYIGEIWTAKLYMTDKLEDTNILFSNPDLSCILDLDINKITSYEEFENANL